MNPFKRLPPLSSLLKPLPCRLRPVPNVAATLLPSRHRRNAYSTTTTATGKKPHLQTTILRDPNAPGARLPSPKCVALMLNGAPHSFDNIFLRDSCSCAHCVDPNTQQKLFRTTDIPTDIRPLAAMALGDGAVRITWDPATDVPVTNPRRKNHTSLYSAEFLLRYSSQRHIVRARFNDRRLVLWDRGVMATDVVWLDWEEYLAPDGLFKALTALSLYGLFFLRGVPGVESSVGKAAAQIGEAENTFYGRTWDVRSLPDSRNIANTSLGLELHMDLLYFASPPGVQFLHCMRNDATGGSSIFADAFRAATAVRMTSSSLWQSLLTYPVPFHYRNDGQHYHHVHPTVVLDEGDYRANKRIAHVNYSPPFQAAFEHHPTDPLFSGEFRRFARALRVFTDGVEDAGARFEITLKEGECAVFANRRVLHGRREFDSGSGERWLRGAYVGTDVFMSKWRVMNERYKKLRFEDEGDYGYVRDV